MEYRAPRSNRLSRAARLTACLALLMLAASTGAACGSDDATSTATGAGTETGPDPGFDPAAANRDTVGETLAEHKQLRALSRAFDDAGLSERLGSDAKFTVLAPSQQAVRELGDSATPDTWSNHVVAGRFPISDLADGDVLTTLGGTKLTVSKPENGPVAIGNARLVQPNILASNGVIHLVDSVIDPAASSPEK